MLHVKSLDESLKLFKALGSHVRLGIIRMLMTNKDLNMNELASRLHITNAALTLHVRKLEECGLIAISESHGSQKQYFVQPDKILVDMDIRGTLPIRIVSRPIFSGLQRVTWSMRYLI